GPGNENVACPRRQAVHGRSQQCGAVRYVHGRGLLPGGAVAAHEGRVPAAGHFLDRHPRHSDGQISGGHLATRRHPPGRFVAQPVLVSRVVVPEPAVAREVTGPDTAPSFLKEFPAWPPFPLEALSEALHQVCLPIWRYTIVQTILSSVR